MNNVDNISSFIYIDIFSVCLEGKGNKRIFIFKKNLFIFRQKKYFLVESIFRIVWKVHTFLGKGTYLLAKKYLRFGKKVRTFSPTAIIFFESSYIQSFTKVLFPQKNLFFYPIREPYRTAIKKWRNVGMFKRLIV